MSRQTLLCLAATLLACSLPAKEFSGARALEYTGKAVAFGPRPSGSAAIHQLQAHILGSLKSRGCTVTTDDFTAATPNGPVAMRNLVAKFPGKSGRAVVITGHYDTKILPHFVGANDGGSSTGFLLEMADALQGTMHRDDIYLVWLDGEEAVRQWSETDSLYGSRHLAAKWSQDGTLAHVKALLNIDMIGDKDLHLEFDMDSAQSLRELVWNTADRLGFTAEFPRQANQIGDDHIPFLRMGVKALDLIDLNYGPSNTYWHTAKDTIDKLDPHSFQVVGTVVQAVLKELEGIQ